MKPFRAAYLRNADGVNCVLLTGISECEKPDNELLSIAQRELSASRIMRMPGDSIEIGVWSWLDQQQGLSDYAPPNVSEQYYAAFWLSPARLKWLVGERHLNVTSEDGHISKAVGNLDEIMSLIGFAALEGDHRLIKMDKCA